MVENTPKVPVEFDDGWEQNFTGKNIERIKDQNGTFRYSALYIQFNKTVSASDIATQPNLDKTLTEVKEMSLSAVNRLIDNYRSVTRSGFVQRLGSLEINTIYFIDLNQGFYILSSGFGIETAAMNRSRDEIKKIEEMLEKGEKPELYDLLLLDAQTSFENKDLTLAVIQSFQALEIFLENLLYKLLLVRGDSETSALQYLDQHRRTKERLKDCLQELKNTTLYAVNRPLWDKWCTLYDKTRNEIVHKGKEPTDREVADMLEANTKVIEWLKTI
jgi:HEPN domain-containing protein